MKPLTLLNIMNLSTNESTTPSKEGYLSRLTFVCTGVFEKISRDILEKFINENGGRMADAVSGVTSYLLAGDDVSKGAKYRAAKAKKITILNEEGFEQLVQKLSGNEGFNFRSGILKEID